jgi:hypothetical protein
MTHPTEFPQHGQGQDANHIEVPIGFPSQVVPAVQPSHVVPSQATQLDASDPLIYGYEQTFLLVNGLDEDTHARTGTSIIEPGSILDINGRTYQGYREGKYFLPNDPVYAKGLVEPSCANSRNRPNKIV